MGGGPDELLIYNQARAAAEASLQHSRGILQHCNADLAACRAFVDANPGNRNHPQFLRRCTQALLAINNNDRSVTLQNRGISPLVQGANREFRKFTEKLRADARSSRDQTVSEAAATAAQGFARGIAALDAIIARKAVIVNNLIAPIQAAAAAQAAPVPAQAAPVPAQAAPVPAAPLPVPADAASAAALSPLPLASASVSAGAEDSDAEDSGAGAAAEDAPQVVSSSSEPPPNLKKKLTIMPLEQAGSVATEPSSPQSALPIATQVSSLAQAKNLGTGRQSIVSMTSGTPLHSFDALQSALPIATQASSLTQAKNLTRRM